MQLVLVLIIGSIKNYYIGLATCTNTTKRETKVNFASSIIMEAADN